MLTLALAATLIGFVLLILGLVTGTVWLAVGCIVVCLIGLAFLLVDVLTGRQRESGRSLEDLVPGARDTDDGETDDHDTDDHDTDDRRADDDDSYVAGRASDRGPDGIDDSSDTVTQSFGSPTRETDSGRRRASYDPPTFEPGMADPRGVGGGEDPRHRPQNAPDTWGQGPTARPAPERREGTLEDYVRSVGGDVTPPEVNSGGDLRGVGGPGAPASPDIRRPGPGGQPERDFRRTTGPDAQTGPAPRPQNPGWQGGPPPPSYPAVKPPESEPRPPARTEKFDPLDPNWRPPLD